MSSPRATLHNGVKHGLEEWYRESGELDHGGINNMGQKCGEWIEDGDPKTYPPCPPGLEAGN